MRPYIESYITVSPHIESGTQKAVKSGGVDEMNNIQKLTYNHNKSATKKKMMICDDEPDMRLLFGLMFPHHV